MHQQNSLDLDSILSWRRVV